MLTKKTLNEILSQIGSDGIALAEFDFNTNGPFLDYLEKHVDFLIKAGIKCEKEDIITYFAASYWESREMIGEEIARNRDTRRAVEPNLRNFLPLLHDIECATAFVHEWFADKGFSDESRERLTVLVNKAGVKAYSGRNGSALLYEYDLQLKEKARKLKMSFREDVKRCSSSVQSEQFNLSFVKQEEYNNSFVLYWNNLNLEENK